MTRAEKIAAWVAVLGALAALGWAGGQLTVHADAELGTGADEPGEDDGAAYTDRVARGHLSGDGSGVSPQHPLYRRHDGHAMRKALCGGGWAWYLDPPSSASL